MHAGTQSEITVIKNQTGKLFCNVTFPAGSSDENPSQIRWYKGAELIYMLTSEGRNVPVRQMTHRPSASWRDRLQVRATRMPIWLSIDPVSMYDQGDYYCLVYYGNDLKRNVSHYLKVIGWFFILCFSLDTDDGASNVVFFLGVHVAPATPCRDSAATLEEWGFWLKGYSEQNVPYDIQGSQTCISQKHRKGIYGLLL